MLPYLNPKLYLFKEKIDTFNNNKIIVNMKLYDFLNYKFRKLTKIFRIKRHMNILFAITFCGFALNIFFTIQIYKKMDSLLHTLKSLEHKLIDKKIYLDDVNKDQ